MTVYSRCLIACGLVASQPACARAGYDLVVRETGAPTWQELGASADGGGVSNHSARALCQRVNVSPLGRAYVAWADASSGQQEVYVKYWDGTAWAAFGGSGDGSGISQGAGVASGGGYGTCAGSIAFDSSGRPHQTFMSYQGGSTQPTYLRAWNDSIWAEMGGSATGNGVSTGGATWWPDIVIDTASRPVVAWHRAGGIYVRRFDSGVWVGLAGSDASSGLGQGLGSAGNVNLALGTGNQLYVAWVDDRTGVDEAYLLHWNNSAWVGLGGSDTGGGMSATGIASASASVRTTRSGNPVVMWADEASNVGTIHLRYWDGQAWRTYGGAATLADAGLALGAALHPNFDLTADDMPVVVWEEDDTLGRNIHGGWWNGSSWESIDPAGELGGISQSAARSTWPEVAVSPDGAVFVSWHEEINASVQEIYLRVLR